MVLSLCAAAVLWVLAHPAGAVVLAAATTVALGVEVARRLSGEFGRAFLRKLGPLLRATEVTGVTGATHLAIGFTAAAVLFPGWPAVAGVLVAGLADPAAGLAGTGPGRHRFRGGKSMEGSVAFLMVAVAALLAVPGLGVGRAFGLAVVLTLVEALRLPVHDNVYIPSVTAALVALVL